MNRITTKDIKNEFIELIQDKTNYRYDKFSNQYFVEIQDCHFIADSEYIIKHNKIIYDNSWYINNYDPVLTYNQFLKAVNNLVYDKYSRKSFMYMGDKQENDICTTGMQMIMKNENKLNWIVNMRSNNIIKYTTDYHWQMSWFDHACFMLSKRIGRQILKGTLYWNACSMHVYEEDFELFNK